MKLHLVLLLLCVGACFSQRKGDFQQLEIENESNDEYDDDNGINAIEIENDPVDGFDDDVDYELANDVREVALEQIMSKDARPGWFRRIRVRKIVRKVKKVVKKTKKFVKKVVKKTKKFVKKVVKKTKKIVKKTKKFVKAVANQFKRLKKCYPPYGCFTNQKPWNLLWHVLPKSPRVMRTLFKLYTRTNTNGIKVNPFRVRSSGLDGRKKTIFIIHGWRGHYKKVTWVRSMKDEFLKRGDFNVIGVYWPGGARAGYFQSAGNTRLVGAQVAYLIEKLCRYQKLSYRRVHLIGFSLGAHVAGFAGRRIREKRHLVSRITGLDPAGPVFARRPRKARLDSTDARFVDVIHTSFNYFVGIMGRCGHVDFYVNGGGKQPGCWPKLATCSHFRAVVLFTTTINPVCTYTAHKCWRYIKFKLGFCRNCRKTSCIKMGYDVPQNARGRYYVKTSGKNPYCRRRSQSFTGNIARGRPTSQSSTGYGGVSSRAVDGNKNTRYSGHSCTCTRLQKNPWWRVDLGRQRLIGKVKLTNRGDCCSNRLRQIFIRVGNARTPCRNAECIFYPGAIGKGQTKELHCRRSRRGRYVFVTLLGYRYLTLCEVQVFALR